MRIAYATLSPRWVMQRCVRRSIVLIVKFDGGNDGPHTSLRFACSRILCVCVGTLTNCSVGVFSALIIVPSNGSPSTLVAFFRLAQYNACVLELEDNRS